MAFSESLGIGEKTFLRINKEFKTKENEHSNISSTECYNECDVIKKSPINEQRNVRKHGKKKVPKRYSAKYSSHKSRENVDRNKLDTFINGKGSVMLSNRLDFDSPISEKKKIFSKENLCEGRNELSSNEAPAIPAIKQNVFSEKNCNEKISNSDYENMYCEPFINIEDVSFSYFNKSEFEKEDHNEKNEQTQIKKDFYDMLKEENIPIDNCLKVQPLHDCSNETNNINSNEKKSNRESQNSNKINCRNSLKFWGLPSVLLEEYKKKGITEMFDWQVQCLNNEKVLFESANLVYSAPTSGGKSLIYEILTLKTVIEKRKTALIILPFVSLVKEKTIYLQDIMVPCGYRVEGFFGGYTPPGSFESINIVVSTIEKANSIINKLLEQKKLEQLGIVVVDELHLISDCGRGYILELLMSKILYMSKHFSSKIQIVAMSATLANINLLKQWLNAELFETEFRPVELKEMIKIGKNIYNNRMDLVRKLSFNELSENIEDQENIFHLCLETLVEDGAVIVFCPTKEWCENLAQQLANHIERIYKSHPIVRNKINMDNLKDILLRLKNCPTGLDSILKTTVRYGVAFHHAGLTSEERDIIELGFRTNILKILVATSTLSSGVNLPARRVIIRTPLFAGKKMSSLTYRQMIGRAGRTGKDILGESILICNETNEVHGKDLVLSETQPVSSCLKSENNEFLRRAFLEVISSGISSTKSEIENFLKCTLLYTQEYIQKQEMPINDSFRKFSEFFSIDLHLQFLIDYEFVRLNTDKNTMLETYAPTRLGFACLSSTLPPTDGLLLFTELQKARKCFVIESELHAIYLVTPYSVCFQLQNLDWLFFLDLWETLSSSMKRVGEMVGIKESFLVKAMRGNNKLDYKLLQIHKRFYTALALLELVNEVPITIVSAKFKCNRGLIQSLQQMASTFAGLVSSFCNSLNWEMLALILSQFKDRLFFGVHTEIIDLMQLTNLNTQRARALFKAGITCLNDLAKSEVCIVENILLDCVSFETERRRDDEDENEANKRKQLRNICVTGKSDLIAKDAAEMLISMARKFIQHKLGVKNVKWSNDVTIFEKKASPVFGENAENFSNKCTNFVSNEIPKKMKEGYITKNTTDEELQDMPTFISNLSDIFDSSFHIKNTQELKINSSEQPENNMKINEIDLTANFRKDVNESRNGPLQFGKRKTHYGWKVKHKNQLAKKYKIYYEKTRKLSSSQIKSTTSGSPNNSQLSLKSTSFSDSVQLTSSNILNESNYENKLNLFFSLKIINSCGNKQLFKKSIKKILSCKIIGISLSLCEIYKKFKPLIGANLLKKELEEKNNFLFVINDLFYVEGISICFDDDVVCYINLQTEGSDPSITLQEKIDAIKRIVQRENIDIIVFDSKEQCKILQTILNDLKFISIKILDPKIANWLLQPNVKPNFQEMVNKFAPECNGILELAGNCNSSSYNGSNYKSSILGKIRSAVDACVSVHIMYGQLANLRRIDEGRLTKYFQEIEMPIQSLLCSMELFGFPTNKSILQNIYKETMDIMKQVEKKIFELHGSQFNLSSSVAVARVLGLHKKPNGRYNTCKQVLERVDNCISNLILSYRKMNLVLTKIIAPLLGKVVENRIYGRSISLTKTGRISMQEPNLQNIPKEFRIEVSEEKNFNISFRKAFNPGINKVLLSCDFCQLELRVLTHLSKDEALLSVMNSNSDIFIALSAKWNKIREEDVSSQLRNGTKKICYGIIYGMGSKALAHSLHCTEEEAAFLSKQFHECYSGIRNYTKKVIEFAKTKGYVETIFGRRRYLPDLKSSSLVEKAQAERQAINSVIQGSAADIVKTAMLKVDNILQNSKQKINLVLHVHDELIYEALKSNSTQAVEIIRGGMKNVVQISVPLPVKIKIGNSWGELNEIMTE